jgi:hypothetical protein
MKEKRLHLPPQSQPIFSRSIHLDPGFLFPAIWNDPESPISSLDGVRALALSAHLSGPADFWGPVQLLYQSCEPAILLFEIPGEKL